MYRYYKLWLSNDNELLDYEEYKNDIYIYTEHINELVYKLSHCYNIIINRLYFLIRK
jgi:hypothetical protein